MATPTRPPDPPQAEEFLPRQRPRPARPARLTAPPDPPQAQEFLPPNFQPPNFQPARRNRRRLMSRDAHLAWAKARALELIDTEPRLGQVTAALIIDLKKHPATARLVNSALLTDGIAALTSRAPKEQLRAWIAGIA